MTHWKLTLAYDGTPYHGWQIQPGLTTVQGTLSDAIYRALRQQVLPQGSGRTDTGVHALGQVASFSLDAPIPPGRLQLALNRCLPASIRVLSAELVPANFHARHSAVRKTYEYRIFPLRPSSFPPEADFVPEAICPPTLAPFVWPCPWPLDLKALNQAASHVVGEHDFTTFAASDPDLAARSEPPRLVPTESCIALTAEKAAQARTPIRTIMQSEWHEKDGLLIYRVTATGFLHHMVRNLVGTFVQSGARRLAPDSIPQLLAARDRSISGPTAPASGLFLISVEYPNEQRTTNGEHR
jgi:tRNA pseudouridine38-40 synthase